MNSSRLAHAVFILILLACTRFAGAQNPVQWSGNVSQAVGRAAEQSLPLLFWVTEGSDYDDDDLSDAQSDCFRDPVVVGIIQKCYVPVRVSRNSNVLKEAEKLGLPTSHGLYCAVITHDGRLLDQMGPGEVADPSKFAPHLTSAYTKYCDDLYQKELRPILEDLKAAKSRVRLAARAVWRLKIRAADKAIIGLLSRPDLTPTETGRVYELLAGLGTRDCIATLLERADDKAAAVALQKAEPDALEWLLPQMPGEEGEVSAKQYWVYFAVTRICKLSAQRSMDWWKKATAEDRKKELGRVQAKAETVLEYWQQSQAPQR